MLTQQKFVRVVHVMVSLFLGSFYGLFMAFIGSKLLTFIGPTDRVVLMLLFVLGTAIGATHVYERDLPRISPTNVVGLLVNLFALMGMLSGAVMTRYMRTDHTLFILASIVAGVALAVLIGGYYRRCLQRIPSLVDGGNHAHHLAR